MTGIKSIGILKKKKNETQGVGGVYRGTNDQTPPHELHFYLSNVSLTNPRLIVF